jgi:hypothetical protein
MFTAPAAQAYPAGVNASPAASDSVTTTSITAHRTSIIGPRSAGSAAADPEAITCSQDPTTPLPQNILGTPTIRASNLILCFDADTLQPASVPSIRGFEDLFLGDTSEDVVNPTVVNTDHLQTAVSAAPCSNGNWSNTTIISVTFPAGFTPDQWNPGGVSKSSEIVNCGGSSGGGGGCAISSPTQSAAVASRPRPEATVCP